MTEGDEANVTLINSACDEMFVDGPGHPLDGAPFGPLPTYNENSMLEFMYMVFITTLVMMHHMLE